jgi:hypothetical protein
MTLIYPRIISTSGDTKDFIEVLNVIGKGVLGVEKGTTTGEIDEDYLAVKASASNVNLTEEEAYDLIDEIRSKLEINKHE